MSMRPWLLALSCLAWPVSSSAQGISVNDTAAAVGAAFQEAYPELADGSFWLSLQQRGWALDRGEALRVYSEEFGRAMAELLPGARPVRQGEAKVACPEGRGDREPRGCPIENGWPILFIDGFEDLGEGMLELSFHVKSQYGEWSHSVGVTARLRMGADRQWEVLEVVTAWAT